MKQIDVENPFRGSPVYYLEHTDSTMNDAKRLADRESPVGTVVCTGYQSAGRGRLRNRRWEGEKEQNLLFSMLLAKTGHPWKTATIALKLGLAVSLALEKRFELFPRIKWPNDVLLDNKKIAGVLCEVSGRYIIAGIGANCNQTRFDASFKQPAGSIGMFITESLDIFSLLHLILREIHEVLNVSSWREEIDKRLYYKNKKICFKTGDPKKNNIVTGTLLGVHDSGEIVILPENQNEPHLYSSGEIVSVG